MFASRTSEQKAVSSGYTEGAAAVREADIEPGDESPVESEEAESAGEYEQTGSLGTGTQGDSIARELAERERRSDS